MVGDRNVSFSRKGEGRQGVSTAAQADAAALRSHLRAEFGRDGQIICRPASVYHAITARQPEPGVPAAGVTPGGGEIWRVMRELTAVYESLT